MKKKKGGHDDDDKRGHDDDKRGHDDDRFEGLPEDHKRRPYPTKPLPSISLPTKPPTESPAKWGIL